VVAIITVECSGPDAPASDANVGDGAGIVIIARSLVVDVLTP